jgi:hypothetical protein
MPDQNSGQSQRKTIPMPHVFISYVRENKEIVDRLAQALRSAGVEVWLDREKIKPGHRWKDAIREAIRQGDFFIACFSKAYDDRERTFMNEELTLAIDELRSRPTARAWFIPVLLSACDVPNRQISQVETLRDIQWVELYEDWEGGLQRILSVIQPDSVESLSSRTRSIGRIENAEVSRWFEGLCTPHYVSPTVLIHKSLDDLKSSRTDWFREYETLNDFNALRNHISVLLLAEPGFGKSEFLRQYASHLVQSGEKVFPLYLELTKYKPYGGFKEYVETQIKLTFQKSLSLSELKREFQIVFLFDGLDEVPQNSLQSVVEGIELLSIDHPDARRIVSCRSHFYLRYPLLENRNFTIAQLGRFGHDQIEQYMKAKGLESREASRLIDQVREQHLSSILSIPRYLEKYVDLYPKGAEAKLSKSDIYNHFVDTRLAVEDQKYPGRGQKELYRNLLQKLALIMQLYQQNTISRSEVITVLDRLDSSLVQALLSQNPIESLIEKNLLVEYNGEISFEERSLQEYLAACEMAQWKNQKKVYDLAVVEEVHEINPSWVNTLAYYLDLDTSFFECAVGAHPDLILKSNIEKLTPAQQTEIFRTVFTDCQNKRIWLNHALAERMSKFEPDALKPEIDKSIEDSTLFIQRANIALMIGLIPLREEKYKSWLITCTRDENPALQTHAFKSLEMLDDASVIERTKAAFSHPDGAIREAFLEMCIKLDVEGSVDYLFDAMKQKAKAKHTLRPEAWLAEIESKDAVSKVIRCFAENPDILRMLSIRNPKDKQHVEHFFDRIEAVYDSHIEDLLSQLVFALHPAYQRSTLMHLVARLFKKKNPQIWMTVWLKIVLENVPKLQTGQVVKWHLLLPYSFLSHFITAEDFEHWPHGFNRLRPFKVLTAGMCQLPSWSSRFKRIRKILPLLSSRRKRENSFPITTRKWRKSRSSIA